MESKPQKPELRNNPKTFTHASIWIKSSNYKLFNSSGET